MDEIESTERELSLIRDASLGGRLSGGEGIVNRAGSTSPRGGAMPSTGTSGVALILTGPIVFVVYLFPTV